MVASNGVWNERMLVSYLQRHNMNVVSKSFVLTNEA